MTETLDKRFEQLGKAIRARREEQGLSQRQLAQMIGQSRSHTYVGRVEMGRVKVGFEQIIKIADALDTKVSDLIDF